MAFPAMTRSAGFSACSIRSSSGRRFSGSSLVSPSNAKGLWRSTARFCAARSNALAETINGLYKAEVIHRRGPWRNFEAVEFATLEWVDWFNNRRLLEPIGFIPPAEAEERYFAMLNDTAMAASLKQNRLRQSRSGSLTEHGRPKALRHRRGLRPLTAC